MRRLFGSRITSGAVAGVLALAAAGGGYAVASGSTKKIHACVTRHTHVLYVGKCKHHDKKLIWNQVGPQGPAGPGATKLVFNATGTASPTPTALGSMGPWTLKASCTQPSAGTTKANLFITGPGGTIDALQASGTTGAPNMADGSQPFPPLSNVNLFGGVTSNTSSPIIDFGEVLWMPTSGQSVQTQILVQATGAGTNTCHESVVTTPVS
jgi:hypothetical protein